MDKGKFEDFLSLTKKAFEDITTELVSSEYKISEKGSFKSNHKVAIIIGITGKNKGRILLETDMQIANKFAVAMNFGDSLDNADELYVYMAEFANMIAGRAATYINNKFNERETWLAHPAIFSGEDLEITTPSIQAETVFYTGEQGCFLLDIGFE